MSTWVLGRSAGSLTYGYTLVVKPVMYRGGKPKGNVDAELVLQAMIDYRDYECAVIVTSDGDFACLVRYLYEEGKLERVLSPNRKGNTPAPPPSAKALATLVAAARELIEAGEQQVMAERL